MSEHAKNRPHWLIAPIIGTAAVLAVWAGTAYWFWPEDFAGFPLLVKASMGAMVVITLAAPWVLAIKSNRRQ